MPLLISQRSAVINKNVLNMAEMLVTLRTTGPGDQEAIEGWIKEHGDKDRRDTMMASLAGLPTGTAWFWCPVMDPSIFVRTKVRRIKTFDSSATPKFGEKRPEPKVMAEVDLKALQKRMAATIEKAKAEDPRELRRRIMELEQQARQKQPAQSSARVEVKEVQVPVLRAEDIRAIREALASWEQSVKRVFERAGALMQTALEKQAKQAAPYLERLALVMDRLEKEAIAPTRTVGRGISSEGGRGVATGRQPLTLTPPSRQGIARHISTRDGRPPVVDATVVTDLKDKQVAILQALARFESLGLDRVSKRHAAALSGQSPKSSAYTEHLADLRAAGLIDYVEGGMLRLTAAGRQHAGPVDRPTSTWDLIEAYKAHVLDRYQISLLDVLVQDQELDHETLAERAGKSPRSSAFTEALADMRALALIEYLPGKRVRLSPALLVSGRSQGGGR